MRLADLAMSLAAVLLLHCAPTQGQTQTDALSRELTVLNSPTAFDPRADALSREATVFNDPVAFVSRVEALSREATILNSPAAFDSRTDALSRESTVLNDPRSFAAISDAVSRELSFRSGVDPLADARRALSIVAGLIQATGADMVLDVATPKNNRIDLLDAVRLARQAMRL